MWFYCFDELGNLYRGGEKIVSFETCEESFISSGCDIKYIPNHHKNKIFVYFANGGHRILPKTEGKVYYRTFWLKEKDNKKAGEIAHEWVKRR